MPAQPAKNKKAPYSPVVPVTRPSPGGCFRVEFIIALTHSLCNHTHPLYLLTAPPCLLLFHILECVKLSSQSCDQFCCSIIAPSFHIPSTTARVYILIRGLHVQVPRPQQRIVPILEPASFRSSILVVVPYLTTPSEIASISSKV